MTRLRTRLIAAFLASTLLPLGATVWITTSLLDRSLRYATTGELDRLSRTLENTAKQFYQRERDALKQDALAGPGAPDDLPGGGRVASGRSRSDRSGRAVSPSASASPALAASAWTTCGGSTGRTARRASRSTAATWAASAWSSCPPSFDRPASSSTRSMRGICGADSR